MYFKAANTIPCGFSELSVAYSAQSAPDPPFYCSILLSLAFNDFCILVLICSSLSVCLSVCMATFPSQIQRYRLEEPAAAVANILPFLILADFPSLGGHSLCAVQLLGTKDSRKAAIDYFHRVLYLKQLRPAPVGNNRSVQSIFP